MGRCYCLHFLQGVCLFLSPFLLSPSVTLSLIHCLTHRLMPHLFFSDHQTFGFHMICYNVMILLCSWFVFWKTFVCRSSAVTKGVFKVMYTLQSFDQVSFSYVKNKESFVLQFCDMEVTIVIFSHPAIVNKKHGYQTVLVTD